VRAGSRSMDGCLDSNTMRTKPPRSAP